MNQTEKSIREHFRGIYQQYKQMIAVDMQDEKKARNRGDYFEARIAESCEMLDFCYLIFRILSLPVYSTPKATKNLFSRNSGLQSKLN